MKSPVGLQIQMPEICKYPQSRASRTFATLSSVIKAGKFFVLYEIARLSYMAIRMVIDVLYSASSHHLIFNSQYLSL